MSRILVIDDDPRLRSMLQSSLEVAGYEITTAENGEEGLLALQNEPINLVLCDLFMPLKEGLETIREIRTGFPAIPVIAMSGGYPGKEMDLLPMARALGATETLHKPFARTDLLLAVTKALEGKN